MSTVPTGPPGALDAELTRTRERLVNQIWRAAGWLSALDIPVIAWRASDVGWHLQLRAHVVLFAIAIGVAVMRRRLGYTLKAALLVAATFGVGVTGVLSLGMVGAGFFWVALSVGLVSVLFSLRAGVIVGVLAACTMIAAGAGFVSGRLTIPFDLNAHAVSTSGWLNFLVVTTIVPFVMLYAIGGFQRAVLQLLAQIHSQRDQLLVQRDQLDAQRGQLEALASQDPLTGLPIARLATDRLQAALDRARSHGARVSLMFIDLDGFKAVNDAHGHDAGDRVLQEIARRLVVAVRADDMVARVGGDEFVVVLEGHAESDTVAALARKLIDSVALPIELASTTLSVGASIGIASFPDHANRVADLKRLADEAMYRAKRSGTNRYCIAEATGVEAA